MGHEGVLILGVHDLFYKEFVTLFANLQYFTLISMSLCCTCNDRGTPSYPLPVHFTG